MKLQGQIAVITGGGTGIGLGIAHAFAEAIKIAPKLSKDTIIAVDSCGDAKKDMKIIKERLIRGI